MQSNCLNRQTRHIALQIGPHCIADPASAYFGCGGTSTLCTKVHDNNELHPFHFWACIWALSLMARHGLVPIFSKSESPQVRATLQPQTWTPSTTMTSRQLSPIPFHSQHHSTLLVSVIRLSYSPTATATTGTRQPKLGLQTRRLFPGLANTLCGLK